jgi:hypothetical protein
MSVYSLVYVSDCLLDLHRPAHQYEIIRILEVATIVNAALDVTGALLFSEGKFVQALEGPQSHVKLLMERISRDRRHTNVEIITGQFCSHRRFTDWSMAFAGDCPRLRAKFAHLRLNSDDILQGDALLDFMREIVSGEPQMV